LELFLAAARGESLCVDREEEVVSLEEEEEEGVSLE